MYYMANLFNIKSKKNRIIELNNFIIDYRIFDLINSG